MSFIFLIALAFICVIIAVAVPSQFKILPGIGVLILSLMAVSQLITIVPAGHVGVVDTFGRVSDTTLKSGLNMVNPFASVPKMSIQTQEIKEVMDVPSKEGLSINLEISALYHLDPAKASSVYKEVGTDYADVLVVPNFRSTTRGVTAQYEAKALYTSERERLANEILAELRAIVGPRGVDIESTPLRKIGLPPDLSKAIEAKMTADQEQQRYTYVIETAKKEAERKRVEAQGIHDFQQIVTQGISEPLLQWKGIEATEMLAKSPNTKIIVVGGGKSGLPLIFNGSNP